MIRAFHSRAGHVGLVVLFILAEVAFPKYGLVARGAPTDDWPPRLSEPYFGGQPREVKPILPHVMKQMAEVVLKMADGAVDHVDTFIAESKQIRNTYMLQEYVVFPPVRPYEWGAGVVYDLRNAAGDAGKGISSISLVQAEMLEHRDRVRAIAKRYENEVEIPSDADALEAFLKQQTEEAIAIHAAVNWSMRGREYIAMWVLGSLTYTDDELEEYQTRINEILQPKFLKALDDDPIYKSSLDVGERVAREWEVFKELAEPYAAEEERLIDTCVARYMRLAEYTKVMQDQIADQVVAFVEKTPPQWGEIPLCEELYNPIRWPNDVFYPPLHRYQNDFVGRGMVWLHAYFYVPDEIETPYGTATLDFNDGFTLDWKVRAPNTPYIELVKDEPPAYPNYTIYYPPTMPEVITWGNGIPGPDSGDWSELLPQAIIDEHELDGEWIVMAVHGQHLFDIELEKPELTWAGGDRHLDYKLLHSGTYTWEKVDGADDPQWWNFWRALHLRGESKPSLRMEHSDVYIVAVHLAPNTWAGRYGFKVGDLPIDWTLGFAVNVATTRFVRQVVNDAAHLGDGHEYESIYAVFKYDRFYMEIETSGDVLTDNRIPFELIVSHDGDPLSVVGFGEKQDATTLHAYRVGNNRRLYRSDPFFVQRSHGLNGWRVRDGEREAGIAMGAGDRLTARVVPFGVARQGTLGMVRVYTAPAEVGASWREAVMRAAEIMKVTPPRAWERLSGAEFNKILREDWETVDSTPYVRKGGREIQLTLGDLAAMLLVREKFITATKAGLPHLQQGRDALDRDPSYARALYFMMAPAALREKSAIGDIQVPMWDVAIPDLAIDAVYKTDFRNAYNEEWLQEKFKGANPWVWRMKAAAYTYREYVKAAEESLEYAEELDLTDATDLLKLTTIGMGRLTAEIKPNLLRLVEDRDTIDGFRWKVDPVARSYVGTIGALGQEFLDNEALIDQYNAMTLVVAAGASVMLPVLIPEAVIGAGITGGIGVASIAAVLSRDLPEYFSRNKDVKFALGAYQIIGEERYITAELRRIPGWAIALELAGGGIDVFASLVQLRHARTAWVALRADDEIAKVFTEPAVFRTLSEDAQKSALIRLAQVSDMKAAGKSLSPVEVDIVERGSLMLNDLGTFGDMPSPLRLLDPAGSRTVPPPIILDDGSIAFISPNRLLDAPPVGGVDAPAAPVQSIGGEPLRIQPQRPWHIFEVQGVLGGGASAQVFEVAAGGGLRRALKVYKAGPEGVADVQRSIQAHTMLEEAGIPQLRIIDHGVHDNMAYLVQEFMPSPGMYQPVRGEMMAEGMQRALLELHQKLGKAKIGWADGWWANIYFRELDDGTFIAGILDQDRMWRYGTGIRTGVFTPQAANATETLIEIGYIDMFRIRSMRGVQHSDDALALLHQGYCPWPDADYFMMKMLEHRGWIQYDEAAGQFVSDRMNIDLVREYFPRLDHPDSIGPTFDVPEHLLHLVPDLPGNVPEGSQAFNTLPFPEIMTWVVQPMRIAA